MDQEIEDRQRKRKIRKRLLERLIKCILSGKFNSEKESVFNLNNPLGPRRQYYSPIERNTHNYGYATMPEVSKG